MDVLAAITDFQHLWFVAATFALFTDELHICKELHFNCYRAVPLAGFAAASGNIERKITRGEAPLLCFGKGSEQLADRVEDLDVGNWIGTRSSPDRRLIHKDYVINELRAFQTVPNRRGKRTAVRLPLCSGQCLVQNIMQQR